MWSSSSSLLPHKKCLGTEHFQPALQVSLVPVLLLSPFSTRNVLLTFVSKDDENETQKGVEFGVWREGHVSLESRQGFAGSKTYSHLLPASRWPHPHGSLQHYGESHDTVDLDQEVEAALLTSTHMAGKGTWDTLIPKNVQPLIWDQSSALKY